LIELAKEPTFWFVRRSISRASEGSLKGSLRTQVVRMRSINKSISDNALSVEQAGEVGQTAGVKTLVLNHFVLGGDSVPEHVWLEAARKTFSGEVIVGTDLLEI
jgi:hypothetical protein